MGEAIFTEDDTATISDVMRVYDEATLPADDHYDNRPKAEELRIPFVPRPSWQSLGACSGQNLVHVFLSPNHKELKQEKDAREAIAKRICATCVVVEECLEYAIKNKERGGVWGGLNERERKRVRLSRFGHS